MSHLLSSQFFLGLHRHSVSVGDIGSAGDRYTIEHDVLYNLCFGENLQTVAVLTNATLSQRYACSSGGLMVTSSADFVKRKGTAALVLTVLVKKDLGTRWLCTYQILR